ncbi:YjbF family lipoprotein [Vibrio sp. 10N]|uniref:YjbF family lipoprotein n=1 Tax=Vibrio sp. 10N TaxID=3058938 RepID=UPI0030C711A0
MKFKSTLIMCSLLTITACSQRFQDVNATLAEAFLGADDVVMTAEEIKALPYASAYVRINDGAQIFVVLAFAEPNTATGVTQYKWMSSDRALFVYEKGRLVKTIGLYGDNLHGVTRTEQTANSWRVNYDWMPDYRYGYQGIANRWADGNETINTAVASYQTEKYSERVQFDALDYPLINEYWQDSETGKTVRAVEYIGPQMAKVEFTVLKQPSM